MVPFILFLVGGSAISTGAWMAWHPAGPIVAGSILMLLSVKLLAGQSSK